MCKVREGSCLEKQNSGRGGGESEGSVQMQNFAKEWKPCFSRLLGMQLCSKGGINEHFQTPEWN